MPTRFIVLRTPHASPIPKARSSGHRGPVPSETDHEWTLSWASVMQVTVVVITPVGERDDPRQGCVIRHEQFP